MVFINALISRLFVFFLLTLSLFSQVNGLYRSRAAILPPFRCSRDYSPQVSVLLDASGNYQIFVNAKFESNSVTLLTQSFSVFEEYSVQKFRIPVSFIQSGHFNMEVIISLNGVNVIYQLFDYQVVDTGVVSTHLLDGAWIDIYHYDDDEGKQYNPELAKMNSIDWDYEMSFMAEVGIKTAILQAVFINNYEVKQHNDTCIEYNGSALYPSEIFPNPFPKFTNHEDKVEAILAASDKYGIKVFFGVGNFGWRDFTPTALCWSKRVAAEIFGRYGYHPSLYGWYYTPEMFATFAYDGSATDLLNYAKEFKAFAFDLDPLMYTMLAVNTQGLEKYVPQWTQILNYLDVVTPFYFPVPNQKLYIPMWANMTKNIDCQAWIDIELFKRPIDRSVGLIPRNFSDLLNEMPYYDVLPNLSGYEFTGLLDSPNSPVHLGGERAAVLYKEYQQYYKQHAPTKGIRFATHQK